MTPDELQLRCREYREDGLTVLRGAIPPDLLVRLRASAEEVRRLTRQAEGPRATRPPGGYIGGRVVDDFDDTVDSTPFKEFGEIPVLREFLDAAVGTDFYNDLQAFTLLLQAEDREIVQAWHRDYRDNVPWLDKQRWLSVVDDVRYFCQFNAALYHDISLWVVPGSHRREDTPEEAQVISKESASPPEWGSDDPARAAAYSQAADAYLRSMPGAVRVVLAPGDIAIYRDTAIHLGHYISTVRRATLHGHFENEETRRFFEDHFTALRGT